MNTDGEDQKLVSNLPRIKIGGDTVADCSTTRWASSFVVQPFRASSEREQDALKGWTTNEDLPDDRRGISPFPPILKRVSLIWVHRWLKSSDGAPWADSIALSCPVNRAIYAVIAAISWANAPN